MSSAANYGAVYLGYWLNLLVTLLVFAVNLSIARQLWNAYDRWHSGAAAQLPHADRMVIPKAFIVWTLAWLVWVLLYAVRIRADVLALRGEDPADNPWLTEILPQLLSDVNCALLLATSAGLIFGRKLRSGFYLLAVTFVALILIADFSLLALGSVIGGLHQALAFLHNFAMSTSMLGLVAIGAAFRLRYGARSILILCLLYSLLQPIAFAEAFPGSRPREAMIKVSAESRQVVTHRVEALDDDVRSYVARVVTHGPVTGAEPDPGSAAGNGIPLAVDSSVPVTEAWFVILSSRQGERLTWDQISALLRCFNPEMRIGAGINNYLKLRQEDLLFCIVAMLKLAVAIAVLPCIKRKPTSLASLLARSSAPPTKPDGVSDLFPRLRWKGPQLVLYGAMGAGLLFAGLYVDWGLVVVELVAMAVFGAISWFGRKALRSLAGSDPTEPDDGLTQLGVPDLRGDAATRRPFMPSAQSPAPSHSKVSTTPDSDLHRAPAFSAGNDSLRKLEAATRGATPPSPPHHKRGKSRRRRRRR